MSINLFSFLNVLQSDAYSLIFVRYSSAFCLALLLSVVVVQICLSAVSTGCKEHVSFWPLDALKSVIGSLIFLLFDHANCIFSKFGILLVRTWPSAISNGCVCIRLFWRLVSLPNFNCYLMFLLTGVLLNLDLL